MEDLVALAGVCGAFLIPIVVILTSHQRKMAEMFQRRSQEASAEASELTALRHEVAQLREIVHQQAIALDDVRALSVRDGAAIRDRV